MRGKLKSLVYSVLILCCFLFITANSLPIYADNNNTILVGTAKVNITPMVPIPMSGYGGRKDPFKGIHDDLFARIIVFSDGKNKAILISADLLGFAHSFWDELSKHIEREFGVSRSNIMLCGTHTHGGPRPAYYFNDPPPEVVEYTIELEKRIMDGVKEAVDNLQPACLGAGKGECKMNINRRVRSARGDIVLGRNPNAPCDHEVGVVRIDDVSGNPIAILVNWPCHGVVMGGRNYHITGDWPGATGRFVEKEFGNKIIAPVTAGASGDIAPLYNAQSSFDTGIGEVETIGMLVGEEVVRVAQNVKTTSRGSISGVQRCIKLKGRGEITNKDFPEVGEPTLDVYVRLTALKVGTIVFAGISGEVMNQIGTKIKQQSPFKFTFVLTHCNGTTGYLVTEDAYKEGGYEVRQTKVSSGAEKEIIENLLEMIYDPSLTVVVLSYCYY